jgi:RNA polymerase sigma factor (sigma-70 family)
MDEAELLKALREGDGSLAPLAVSLYGRALSGYLDRVFYWLPQTERELACERAIEKAVSKISHFDQTKGSFAGWVRAFVRHEVLDIVRRGIVSLSAIPTDSLIATAQQSWSPNASPQTELDVARALDMLSPSDQLILTLRTVEGYDYATIAHQLGVDEAACRQRHKRALARLRERLELSPTGQRFIGLERNDQDD